MSPKRGGDVAPPPVDGAWRLRFATNEAAKGWGELGSEAPGNTRRCFEALRKDLASHRDTDRQHRLRGRLSRGTSAAGTFRARGTRSRRVAECVTSWTRRDARCDRHDGRSLHHVHRRPRRTEGPQGLAVLFGDADAACLGARVGGWG
ncbi:hypothetical protein GCM10010250_19730 [Streptomyces althioticus]|nr:hypothetical protein GCM10010250_19730 [Streptomyces althioticus]